MEFFNPFSTFQHQENAKKSPGELAQKWASWIAMGSAWYLNIKWTPDEVEALAKVLAKVIANQRRLFVDQKSLLNPEG